MSCLSNGEIKFDVRPCPRCLHNVLKLVVANVHFMVQCRECGFNQSGPDFKIAVEAWNDFKIWEILDLNAVLLVRD